MENSDLNYMKLALKLAEKGRGYTLSNPMVGAVIVKKGKIIGQGYHKVYGEDHAEVMALKSAQESVEGATMYVTLEPCSHYGKTPPCVQAIVESKISRVVIASIDVNEKVSGRGIKYLKKHDVEVEVGLLEEESKQLNESFNCLCTEKRPFVLYKGAMTLDGKVATYKGDSKNLSSEESRMLVHQLRHEYMAIMVGVGTVLADDPLLNTRIEGLTSPIRVIVDTHLTIPESSKMLTLEESETWIFSSPNADTEKTKRLEALGNVRIIESPLSEDKIDLDFVMDYLCDKGVCNVLLEGGPTLTASMFEKNLIDKIALFIVPKIIGGRDSITIVEGKGVGYLSQGYKIKNLSTNLIGEDLLLIGYVVKEGEDVYRDN